MGPSTKLSSLEMQYSVVLKMYEEAYQNYTKTLKDSVKVVEEDPCAVYSSNSVNVSQACYNKIWKDAGCTTTATDMTTNTSWFSTQTLDGLKTDSGLWATLNDDTHKTGCYGSSSGKQPTDTSNLASLQGYTFWGKTAVSSSTATSDSDCKTSCANNAKCTGATYNESKQLCWIRNGDGEIAAGLSDDYAIVPKLKQQAYVLQQLNEELTKLNSDILTEIENEYGTTDSTSSSSKSSSSTGSSSTSSSSTSSSSKGLMQYAGLFKPSESSIRINKLVADKAQIDNAISQLNGAGPINGEFEDSKLFVKGARIHYLLMFAIFLCLVGFIAQNGTFSKIIAIVIVAVIIIVVSISKS